MSPKLTSCSLKDLKNEPHSQRIAEAAVGLSIDNGRKDEVTMTNIDEEGDEAQENS